MAIIAAKLYTFTSTNYDTMKVTDFLKNWTYAAVDPATYAKQAAAK